MRGFQETSFCILEGKLRSGLANCLGTRGAMFHHWPTLLWSRQKCQVNLAMIDKRCSGTSFPAKMPRYSTVEEGMIPTMSCTYLT